MENPTKDQVKLQENKKQQNIPAKATQSKRKQIQQQIAIKGLDLENLTEEEREQKIKQHIDSLKNPCANCKQQEGEYTLRKQLVCEICYNQKIYSKAYNHIRGAKPMEMFKKVLVAVVGEYPILDQKSSEIIYDPLAADFTVLKTVLGKVRNGNKVLNEIEILYLDLGNENSKLTVQKWAELYKVNLHIKHINEAFGGSDENLAKFLKQFKDQDEVLKIVKYNLIMETSQKLNVDYLCLSDCGQDIAKNTFALVSQGRGISMLQEINSVSKVQYRQKEFLVFRILKDLINSEIYEYYKIQMKLPENKELQEFQKTLQNKQEENSKNAALFDKNLKQKKPTMEDILSTFFDKLQVTFPSTVHTALRSLDKVRDKYQVEKCPCFFCLGKQDKIVNQLELDTYEELGKSKVQQVENLCFGCMRMFKNANISIEQIMENLPPFIKENQIISMKLQEQQKENQ